MPYFTHFMLTSIQLFCTYKSQNAFLWHPDTDHSQNHDDDCNRSATDHNDRVYLVQWITDKPADCLAAVLHLMCPYPDCQNSNAPGLKQESTQ